MTLSDNSNGGYRPAGSNNYGAAGSRPGANTYARPAGFPNPAGTYGRPNGFIGNQGGAGSYGNSGGASYTGQNNSLFGGSVPGPGSAQNGMSDLEKSQNDAYKRTQIETATPENLILMLYDGAIRFMGQAEEAFKEKNIEKISNLLLRVQAIFTELMTSLDKEKGGEIAVNLERLYLFFLQQLSDSNIKKDPEPMLQIKPLVIDLRNTWEQAMQAAGASKHKTAPAQRPRLNFTA